MKNIFIFFWIMRILELSQTQIFIQQWRQKYSANLLFDILFIDLEDTDITIFDNIVFTLNLDFVFIFS